MKKVLPVACLAMLGAGGAVAQDQAADTAQARPDAKPQQVTVSGTRADETETRRLATASKLVVGREELDRNGDTTLGVRLETKI